jgi:hypothetical protein
MSDAYGNTIKLLTHVDIIAGLGLSICIALMATNHHRRNHMYSVDVRKDHWSFDVETMTPAKAEEILNQCNFGNRKLRLSVVEKYSLMMRRGDWHLSPEAIVISNTGKLLNGQHRLSAVVKSGVSVRFLTIRGPSDDVFSVLDRGAVRSTSDALKSDKKATEVARLIVSCAYGGASSYLTDPEVARVLEKISDTHSILINHCNTTAPLLSSAVFRLAVVARMMQGHDIDYLLSLYRNLVLANINDLPPVALALIKLQMNGKILAGGGGHVQIRNLGVAWSVFDPAKRMNERVLFPHTRNYVQEVLEAVGYAKS